MTDQKEMQIARMRSHGDSYGKIAAALGMPVSTVKAHCQRRGLNHKAADQPVCLYCGAEVPQNEGRRPKRYCSDPCRMRWWNEHRHLLKHRAMVTCVCQHCGKNFSAYEKAGRKYCSHGCYIEERFKGGGDDD